MNLDPQSQPFANRAWSHTAAGSCAYELLHRDMGQVSETTRPDRFITIDRRDAGSILHLGSEYSMIGLKAKGKFPKPGTVIRLALKQYPTMAHAEIELTERLALWQERFEFDIDRELACEWRMAIDVDGNLTSYDHAPPGAWRVRVDWAELSADGQLKVIDYKNKPAIDSDSALKSHEQLAGYAYAMSKLAPHVRSRPARLGIYYYQYGVTKVVDVDWPTIDALHERQMARARAKAKLRVIDIVPEPGFGRCQYCDIIGMCPAGSELMSERQAAPTDMEQAKALAKRIFVAEEVVSAGKKALKRFAQEHGNVMIDDDLGYAFKESMSNQVQLKQLIDGLVAEKVELDKVLRVDMDAIKAMAKEHKGVHRLVEANITRAVTGTEFTAVKPKDSKVTVAPTVRERVKKKGKKNEAT